VGQGLANRARLGGEAVSAPLHPPPDQQLLRVSEVAAALHCAHRTVLVWLARGRFPGAIRTPGGRHWRIPAGDVRAVRVELGITDGTGTP
jgi:excisionase family DNA binding protein